MPRNALGSSTSMFSYRTTAKLTKAQIEREIRRMGVLRKISSALRSADRAPTDQSAGLLVELPALLWMLMLLVDECRGLGAGRARYF